MPWRLPHRTEVCRGMGQAAHGSGGIAIPEASKRCERGLVVNMAVLG